jgi:hypothetical protein
MAFRAAQAPDAMAMDCHGVFGVCSLDSVSILDILCALAGEDGMVRFLSPRIEGTK